MPVEIVEKIGPVRFRAVRLEISNRKRETVVDTDQGGRIFGKPFDQPFGDATTGPVFARARWWNHRDGHDIEVLTATEKNPRAVHSPAPRLTASQNKLVLSMRRSWMG